MSSIRNALQEYISDDNPLPITELRYPTMSKDEGAPIVSYFGQDSTVTGKKKRSITEDADENIYVMDNVGIEKTADNSIDVKEKESLKSPVIRSSEFVKLSGPALLDDDHISEPMDQFTVVTSPVVEEHESSRSPEIRAFECAYPSGPPALPADDPMEVVN